MPTKKITCDSCAQPMELILTTNRCKKYKCNLCELTKTKFTGEQAKVIAQARKENRL